MAAQTKQALVQEESFAAASATLAASPQAMKSSQAKTTSEQTAPSTPGFAEPYQGGSMTKINLIVDLLALKQDRQRWGSIATSPPSEVTPSLSAVDSLSAISSVSNLAHQPSVLNASKDSSVPHGVLPENKEVVDTDNNGDMFLVNHCIVPGSPGHDWYLQLRFKYIEG
jgi:hypothetical protein